MFRIVVYCCFDFVGLELKVKSVLLFFGVVAVVTAADVEEVDLKAVVVVDYEMCCYYFDDSCRSCLFLEYCKDLHCCCCYFQDLSSSNVQLTEHLLLVVDRNSTNSQETNLQNSTTYDTGSHYSCCHLLRVQCCCSATQQ